MSRDKFVVLTGAGISQESGLKTFRDAGGLWEGYDINEVASIDGWHSDPGKVLDFYNMRRAQSANAEPNGAHQVLAELENQFDVTIITQNIDELHERAGSSHVVHLHGKVSQARSVNDENLIIDIGENPIKLGDKAPDGHQLRPHIVWFGEMVPMIEVAIQYVIQADYLAVIGTSLLVYPAAGLTDYAPKDIPRYIVDPNFPGHHTLDGWTHIPEKAVSGCKKLKEMLTSI